MICGTKLNYLFSEQLILHFVSARKRNNRTKSDSSTQAEYALAIGEQYSRNSAKYPCNFGKSGTYFIVSDTKVKKATVY